MGVPETGTTLPEFCLPRRAALCWLRAVEHQPTGPPMGQGAAVLDGGHMELAAPR